MATDLDLFTAKILTQADWEKFKENFEIENPGFYSRLHKKTPRLSSSEVRLASLLKLKYDTSKAAEILCIHPKSIIKSRYRLKKKLQLPPKSNLEKWIASI